MREFFKNLFTVNKRDEIGFICWFLTSVLIGWIALPVMVGREVYQYKHYKLTRFEWEDVVRYGIVIVFGSLARHYVCGN